MFQKSFKVSGSFSLILSHIVRPSKTAETFRALEAILDIKIICIIQTTRGAYAWNVLYEVNLCLD